MGIAAADIAAGRDQDIVVGLRSSSSAVEDHGRLRSEGRRIERVCLLAVLRVCVSQPVC